VLIGGEEPAVYVVGIFLKRRVLAGMLVAEVIACGKPLSQLVEEVIAEADGPLAT